MEAGRAGGRTKHIEQQQQQQLMNVVPSAYIAFQAYSAYKYSDLV